MTVHPLHKNSFHHNSKKNINKDIGRENASHRHLFKSAQRVFNFISSHVPVCKVTFLDQELMLFGQCSSNYSKKPKQAIISNQIWTKFGRIVLQVNTHRWRSKILDMRSYFQDGGHGVCPPLTDVNIAASTGCPLTHRVRVKSLARCMCYSSWSMLYSYLFWSPGSTVVRCLSSWHQQEVNLSIIITPEKWLLFNILQYTGLQLYNIDKTYT